MGIDFTGGRVYVVRFAENVRTIDVASALLKPLMSPEVKTFGSNNQVKITTKYKINEDNPNVDNEIETILINTLKRDSRFKSPEIMSSQKVGPTVAADIVKGAFLSVFFGLIGIFLYILLRFRKWQYALGAIVALAHDTIIVMGAYSLLYSIVPFSMEVDLSFIAAILTVIGFSVNDTVIIFDRIREIVSLHKKESLELNMNKAINATLSRTILTSTTVVLVQLAIFTFGSEVIRGFTFALLVGFMIGTYSSIFNATPIAFDLIMYQERKRKLKENKK